MITMDNLSLDRAALATTSETAVLPLSPDHQEMDAHLETLAQEVAHLRLSLLTESESHQSTFKQLRRRLDLLTVSLMLMVLGLVGTGTWFFSSPKGFTLLQQPLSTSTNANPQLKQLERQIADLQGGDNPALVSQVEALQAQVKVLDQQQTSVQALDAKVAELSKNASTRQQSITILAKALQDVINVETDTVTPPPSDSAADSTSPNAQAETSVPKIEEKGNPQPSPADSSKN